ncbi:MAG TPA: non-canonical purine NTP pyrophosphatase, partial [Candidatus Limnocylindrales bacterium]
MPTPRAARRRLLVATRSRHKLRELAELLALPDDVELLSPDDLGIDGEPDETGETFETNARIKARYYASRSGLPTLADDSGLEVDALGGAPGVRTRRFAGEDASDEQNNEKLLRDLAGLPP